MPPQLFNLTADPGEFDNLLAPPAGGGAPPAAARAAAAPLEVALRATVDYPAVARRVAQYNLDSFLAWTNATGPGWEAAMSAPALRWTASWRADPRGAEAAVREWAQRPAEVLPCRGALAWPAPA